MSEVVKKQSQRMLALDILRGITIAGMILVNNPGSWGHIFPPLAHAKWAGCTPTDLVFPFFLFVVGAAMAFSFAKYNEGLTSDSVKKLVKRGIQCMVMEPLKGGALASLTPDANEILLDYAPDKSIASWAFRYVGSLPNVLTVLSGMTKMEHLKDNLATFTDFKPLTEEERGVLDRAIAEYRRYKQIGCTACKYCMPCKFGVDIPAVFEAYNKCVKESKIPDMEGPRDDKFNKKKRAFLATYYNTVPEGARADRCTACGACKTHCPQKLEVPELISRIKNMVKELEK